MIAADSDTATRPCVFLDRDGVVNVSPGDGYVTRWVDFRFQDGIMEVLAMIRERGYPSILVTNQQGVAKGLMTDGDLEEIHGRMQAQLGARGLAFDALYAATERGGTESRRRKPSPAMLHEASAAHAIDLGNSWMIGDDDKDIIAGQRAGTGTIRLLGTKPATVEADHTARSLEDLVALLDTLLRP